MKMNVQVETNKDMETFNNNVRTGANTMNDKMNYEQFKIELSKRLKEELTDCEIFETKTFKNNIQLDAIVIKTNESNLAPNVYVNYIYEDYIDNNYTFDNIVLRTIRCIKQAQNSKPNPQKLLNSLKNIDTLKDNIYPRLMKIQGNEEFLDKLIYRQFLDLAIYYVIQDDNNNANNVSASIRITKHLLDNIKSLDKDITEDITEDTLYSWSLENLNKTDNFIIEMFNFIQCTMFDLDKEDYINEYSEKSDMLILTNKLGLNGSNNLLNNKMLKEVANKVNSDLIILPSSIHEILLLPKNNADNNDMNINQLKEMVQAVNTEEVEIEEQLSDTIYIYKRDIDKVLIAKQ